MINLIDLLENMMSEDTKAAQQRRRKFRMIFELIKKLRERRKA